MGNVVFSLVTITMLAGVVGTGLGGLISAFIKRDSSKIVSLLLSFAGGIMLSVVCFDMLEDTLFPKDAQGNYYVVLTILGVLIGYAVVALLNYLIDKNTNHEVDHVDSDHPRTADDLDELIHSDHFESHKAMNAQLFSAGLIMACAIALHNLPEGMVIGAAFALDPSQAVSYAGSGMIVALIIGFHNIPEGMAVAVPLIAGGMNRIKAVCITALSGFPTVIGALIGYALGTMGALWHVMSLSFASGAMLYVVFGELLPESILMWRSKLPALAVLIGMLSGIALIFIV